MFVSSQHIIQITISYIITTVVRNLSNNIKLNIMNDTYRRFTTVGYNIINYIFVNNDYFIIKKKKRKKFVIDFIKII
jgi:hypothetical protein